MIDERVRVGELRERLTLQTRTATTTADRQRVNAWADTGDFWAKVTAETGSETVTSDAVKGERIWTVTMRYYGTVNAANSRWLWRGRVLEILSVLPDDKRRFMIMRCVERGA